MTSGGSALLSWGEGDPAVSISRSIQRTAEGGSEKDCCWRSWPLECVHARLTGHHRNRTPSFAGNYSAGPHLARGGALVRFARSSANLSDGPRYLEGARR